MIRKLVWRQRLREQHRVAFIAIAREHKPTRSENPHYGAAKNAEIQGAWKKILPDKANAISWIPPQALLKWVLCDACGSITHVVEHNSSMDSDHVSIHEMVKLRHENNEGRVLPRDEALNPRNICTDQLKPSIQDMPSEPLLSQQSKWKHMSLAIPCDVCRFPCVVQSELRSQLGLRILDTDIQKAHYAIHALNHIPEIEIDPCRHAESIEHFDAVAYQLVNSWSGEILDSALKLLEVVFEEPRHDGLRMTTKNDDSAEQWCLRRIQASWSILRTKMNSDVSHFDHMSASKLALWYSQNAIGKNSSWPKSVEDGGIGKSKSKSRNDNHACQARRSAKRVLEAVSPPSSSTESDIFAIMESCSELAFLTLREILDITTPPGTTLAVVSDPTPVNLSSNDGDKVPVHHVHLTAMSPRSQRSRLAVLAQRYSILCSLVRSIAGLNPFPL